MPVSRKARFNSLDESEIELVYPHYGQHDDVANGETRRVYYSARDYQQRQAKHGEVVYPTPIPYEL